MVWRNEVCSEEKSKLVVPARRKKTRRIKWLVFSSKSGGSVVGLFSTGSVDIKSYGTGSVDTNSYGTGSVDIIRLETYEKKEEVWLGFWRR